MKNKHQNNQMTRYFNGNLVDKEGQLVLEEKENFQRLIGRVPDNEKKNLLALFHTRVPHDSPLYLATIDELFCELSDDMGKFIFETYMRHNQHFGFFAKNYISDAENDGDDDDWKVDLLREAFGNKKYQK